MRLSLELILNYKPGLKQHIHKMSKLHYELDELYELERPKCYWEVSKSWQNVNFRPTNYLNSNEIWDFFSAHLTPKLWCEHQSLDQGVEVTGATLILDPAEFDFPSGWWRLTLSPLHTCARCRGGKAIPVLLKQISKHDRSCLVKLGIGKPPVL